MEDPFYQVNDDPPADRPPRNLSGIFFRFQNPSSGRWENWCFEDLPKDTQEAFLAVNSTSWVKSLALALSDVLQRVGDQCDIRCALTELTKEQNVKQSGRVELTEMGYGVHSYNVGVVLEALGLSYSDFLEWMRGQTVTGDEENTYYFRSDLKRYIGLKCFKIPDGFD